MPSPSNEEPNVSVDELDSPISGQDTIAESTATDEPPTDDCETTPQPTPSPGAVSVMNDGSQTDPGSQKGKGLSYGFSGKRAPPTVAGERAIPTTAMERTGRGLSKNSRERNISSDLQHAGPSDNRRRDAGESVPGASDCPYINADLEGGNASNEDSNSTPTQSMAGNVDGYGNSNLVQAYTVEQSIEEIRAGIRAEMEEEARQNTVVANVLEYSEETPQNVDAVYSASMKRRKQIAVFVSLGLVALMTLLVTLLAVLLPSQDNSTLYKIQERGYVNCGVFWTARGFSSPNETTGEMEGMNIDQCRAIAVALLKNSNAVKFVRVETTTRFEALANGEIDVLSTTATHNLQRDVYFGNSTMSGFTFSMPYLYSGMSFWGPPDFLECAEELETMADPCQNLTVCVAADTTHKPLLEDLLPQEAIFPVYNPENLLVSLDERCKVYAADIFYTKPKTLFRHMASGTKLFSSEPLCLVTREDDHEFSSLVNSVVNVLFLAERHQISKANATSLNHWVDPVLAPLLVPVVEEFGNFADLYEEHLESLVPRQGPNRLYSNMDTSGLLYAFPLGNSTIEGGSPGPDAIISRIQDQGLVRCGAIDKGEALAKFDSEFCGALSAGLFQGSTENADMSNFQTEQSAFTALMNGTVDVLVGMRLSVVASYSQPSTGQGFALSSPYYYNTTTMEAYGFATNKNDPKWSDLVDWTARATIIAVDMEINQSTSDKMPLVNLFGKDLNLFQDVVHGVGSYNEIYSRTLEDEIPQAGSGNELNNNLPGPQQFPLSLL